jgi:hypothetical protein
MNLAAVVEFLDHHSDLKMSFCVEYSSVVDWVAEFVPRRGHELARQYNGPWRASGYTPEEALANARDKCLDMIGRTREVRTCGDEVRPVRGPWHGRRLVCDLEAGHEESEHRDSSIEKGHVVSWEAEDKAAVESP